MSLVVGTNSYALRANADAYFDDSLRKDTWKSFTGSERDRAMIESTRVLERQPWQGTKEGDPQTLHFPATGLTDRNGNSVTAAQSLIDISEAQYEYSLFLLEDIDALNESDATGNNFKKLKAGSASVEYFRPSDGTRFPLVLMDLIGSYLSSGQAASIGIPYVSGVDECSSFSNPDSNDLTRAL